MSPGLDKSADRVRGMFSEIAGRYDVMNRVLSLGVDRSWRRRTIRLAPPTGDGPILDLCTGTADLALAYWQAARGKLRVVGVDFCHPMLVIAREKARRAAQGEPLRWSKPMPNNSPLPTRHFKS